MANEPERTIEKLLRAAAKKRGEEAGAPFELHPADRRVLQGEVARRFARPAHEARWLPHRLARLWPICVGAVGIIAVLGTAIWLLMPVTGNERSAMSLAQNQTMGDTEAAKLPSSPPLASPAMPPPPPGPGGGEMSGGLASVETPSPARASEIRQLNELPPQLAKDAIVAPDLHEAKEKLGLAASAQLADREKKEPVQLAAPGGASSLAPAGAVSDAFPFANSQRFVQSVPAPNAQAVFTDKAAPARPVLASFQLQQAGSQLQIVDGDGSVYSGSVRLEDAARRVRSAKTEAPTDALATRAPVESLERKSASTSLYYDSPTSQNFAFRVAGTNRSLNRRVVFTGNLVTDTNPGPALQASTNLSLEGGLGGAQNAPAQQGLLQLNNSRISGKVVVGSGAAVEINALPTNP